MPTFDIRDSDDVSPAWLATPGTALMVETERGTRTATVVPMPLVDRGKRSPYREVSHGR